MRKKTKLIISTFSALILVYFLTLVFSQKESYPIKRVEDASGILTSAVSQKKIAVVSGQSVIGMLSAIILAKHNYQVHCYEKRSQYTRNIQWAARQPLFDQLATIDPSLAEAFLDEIAKPIYRGSIHIHTSNLRRHKSHLGLKRGDPSKLTQDVNLMMSCPSVAIVQVKAFETFLKKYLLTLPNIHFHQSTMSVKKQGSNYIVDDLLYPDLIVVAEGFNSSTRKMLNITLNPAVKSQLQIAGAIGIDSGGIMVKHWREENNHILLTGVMGQAGADKTWLVADVDPEKIINQESKEQEFRRLAAMALDLPIEEVNLLPLYGPMENAPIKEFFLKQAIVESAISGDNLILIGDAVGSGHWSVGGGMQVGAVCHIQKLKKLISDFESHALSKTEALENYSKGVINDTKVWIEVGLNDKPRT